MGDRLGTPGAVGFFFVSLVRTLSFQMIALYFNFVKLEKKPKMNSLTNFLSRFVRTQSFQMSVSSKVELERSFYIAFILFNYFTAS